MDVRMPGMDGIDACRALRESLPDARVVMLTSYSDEDAVYASIMAGAAGYLLKNTPRLNCYLRSGPRPLDSPCLTRLSPRA